MPRSCRAVCPILPRPWTLARPTFAPPMAARVAHFWPAHGPLLPTNVRPKAHFRHAHVPARGPLLPRPWPPPRLTFARHTAHFCPAHGRPQGSLLPRPCPRPRPTFAPPMAAPKAHFCPAHGPLLRRQWSPPGLTFAPRMAMHVPHFCPAHGYGRAPLLPRPWLWACPTFAPPIAAPEDLAHGRGRAQWPGKSGLMGARSGGGLEKMSSRSKKF